MPLKTRFRLTELLFAVAVVAAALVWAERTAGRQISSLRAEMTTDQIARFRSADALRAAILELHYAWRRSIDETNTTNRIELEANGRKVKELIEAQTKKAGSPAEVQLSKEIATAFADYLSRVSKSHDTPVSAASRVAEQEVETGLERLLALGEKLTADNRSAAEHFVTDANAALVRLQRFLFVALLSLSISGIAIVVLIYRRTISPLRSNLTESLAIIERQQADQTLRESERRFVDIIDLAMDAIVTVDHDQRIVIFNSAAEEMFRCPAAEAIGSSLERFIPPRYRTAHHHHVREFAQSGTKTRRASERHGTVMALRADGEEFPVEASISTVETGGKMLFTAILRDITERKRAEDALRESEERFQTLANNMSQLAWMADADGRIFWYNQRWLDYTDTTIEEMKGWGWKKVHHPDHVDRIVASIQHSWDSGQPWEDTFPLRGRDGAYRWFLSRAVPIRDADGRVVRWFGTNTDVTELRDVQESLRNAKDALAKSNQSLEAKVREGIANLTESRAIIERQEKLASLGVFAAGIAHEVRNPLTAIKVRLFTLKSSHKPGTSEHEDLEVIRHEIDRPGDPELQTISVESLLRDVRDLLQSDLAGKSVELKLELLAKEPIRVDPNKMKQVLINFVQNGAESMEAGGTVTLRSRLDKQVLNGRHVAAVVIDVADTGKGISPEVQKRLFDPFFTTKEEGTGLGLPIAARIVEKHGGLIQYQTQPNRGTTFSIVLPLAPKNEIQS